MIQGDHQEPGGRFSRDEPVIRASSHKRQLLPLIDDHQVKGATVLKSMVTLFILGVVSISLAVGYQGDEPAPTAAADTKAPDPTPSATTSPAAAPATPCCGDPKDTTWGPDRAPPPCSCPLYPIHALPGGTFVYYASRFATSCDDTPTAAYVYGIYAYPLTCPGGTCAPSYRPRVGCLDSKGAFPGFEHRFPHDFEHVMPDDVARLHSRRLNDPKVPYIYFTDNDGTERWAKVFTYWLDLRGAHAKIADECKGSPGCHDLDSRLVYFAVEIAQKKPNGQPMPRPSVIYPAGVGTGLNEKSEPTTDPTYVYLVNCNTSSGVPIPILVLCAQQE